VKVQVKQGKRMVIRVNGKLRGVQEGKDMLDRILDVSTEPFRWTPPGTAVRRTT
jgi:hypothetical protein